MAERRRSSWRARAARICSGCCSQREVEPSMSVKRKVTVPLGSSGIGKLHGGYKATVAAKDSDATGDCPNYSKGSDGRLCLQRVLDSRFQAHGMAFLPGFLPGLLIELGAGTGDVALVIGALCRPH